ncbi:MAG TPA: chemotaxis protein CheW [Verrucomicrobium sp.]|nr:chemotaxis protein CheW [Verrucomicrobium sp.]
MNDDVLEKILLRRAAALADRKSHIDAPADVLEVLLLQVGPHLLGLPAADVRQIFSFPRWAPVPEAHPALLGVISVQNDLICLISPYPYLKETSGPVDHFSKAVLLIHPVLRVALGCDEVLGFAKLTPDQIKENRVFESGGRPGILLDANQVLEAFQTASPV